MGAYDCDCLENLLYEDKKKRATMQCRDCNFYAKTLDTEEYVCAHSKERRAPNAICNQRAEDGKMKPLESNAKTIKQTPEEYCAKVNEQVLNLMLEDTIRTLKSEIQHKEMEIAELRGEIRGLKYGVRCNGVSGAEVKE